MKKKLIMCAILAAIMATTLTACGGDTSTPDSSSDASASTSQSTSDTAKDTGESTSGYSFKDNVLTSQDVKIEITDYKVIPVGETGNEYGEKPVIAFWYKTTNLSGNEDVSPLAVWTAMFTCVQDNDANAVNELEAASLPDERFLDSQMETIKKDGTVESAVAYNLDDTETPVTLKATQGIGGADLGEQTYNIK